MNRFIRNVAAVLPFALASVFLLCTDFKNNNPTDSAYVGNYALTLNWQQASDTLEVFKRYRIVCSQGRDTFSSYKVDTASPLSIDSIKWGPKDTLVVHATRPVKIATLFISGVRPNNETVVDSIQAAVINPYIIKPNAIAVMVGDTIIAAIGRRDTQPVLQPLFAVWSDNGSGKTRLSASMPYSIINAQQGAHALAAQLQDSLGNGFDLAADTVSAGGFRQVLDTAVFLTVKLGSPLTVAITQTDSDASPFRLFVASSSGRRDSSGATFRPFKIIDTIQLVDTIKDTATLIDTIFTVDATGLVSRKIAIKALVLYVPPKIAFVNDSMTVQFQDSTAITLAPGSTGAKYIWVMDTTASKPDTTILPTFILFLNDSTQVHSLKVTAVDQYGYAGTPATVYISARTFYYKLNALTFPTQPKVNTWTTWTVSAVDTALARKNNARFHWSVAPRNYDSLLVLGADSGTLKLLWFSVTSTTISVNVIDSQNNTSAVYSQNIAVRRYGPSIKITNPQPLSGNTTGPIKITVSAIDTNVDGSLTNSTINTILWQRTGKNPARDSSSDSSWQISSIVPDTFTVYARARDVDGNLSQPDSIQIFIKAYLPYILPRMDDTSGFTNAAIQFTAYGNVSNPAASIIQYVWSFSGNGPWTDSSSVNTISHTFTKAGKIMAMVKCRDNTTLESAVDTFSITISTGAPQAIKMSPDTVWINHDTLYTITAQANPTTALKQWVVQWDAAGPWDTVATDTLRHAYASAGLKQLTYFVIDNNGTVSNIVNKTATVRLGAPRVVSISADSALSKIFINDSVHFTVQGFDTNGAIDSMKVSWTGDTNFSAVSKTIQGNASVFAGAFATSGAKQIRFRVYDNDGLSADTVFPIFVRKGRPVITSLTPDSVIFINDARKFFISTSDTNGTVDSIKIDNGNGVLGLFVKNVGGLDTLKRTFGRLEAGTRTIRVIAKDNDGLLSDTARDTVTVRLGTPVIDSIHVPATIWINDTNTYQIAAHDTNGTIVKYYFDWTNSGVWQDSSTTGSASGHFNTFGLKTIRFGLLDNDTLLAISTKQITVHLGVPHIWNSSGDTMFVVTPAGGGNDTLRIGSYDTNGTIGQYYWALSSINGLDTMHANYKTPSDSLVYPINQTSVNTSMQIAVFGKDDDGNVSGDTFWLYPDAPPPVPTVTAIAGTDSITIYWKGKDFHDGSLTQYEALLHDGSNPDTTRPQDIISAWKSGYRIADNSPTFDYMMKFKLTANTPQHLFYYQVLAHDARGSISPSVISTFAY